MTQMNMHEAKSQLSSLIARVLEGEKVTIARAGRPLVDIVPHRELTVVYGLAADELEHDPSLFDGVDEEMNELFYGRRS
ncbi:type II toxin-antitoxin system Phd/YefM family antitoxin [Microbacterium sp.]|uniref:type II toxin-antitoxin system Phd/YefM family antitoxin n=1 Tax=Microbacterium sp. TaxID=51671 RepID=UPI003566DAAF